MTMNDYQLCMNTAVDRATEMYQKVMYFLYLAKIEQFEWAWNLPT